MRIHESGEDYLEAILVIKNRSGYVRAVDIAEELDVSKASVSKALANLAREGCVEVVARDVRLTEEGLGVAEAMLERHEYFSELLVAAGVEPETASEEACRIEHCLSQDSFEKLVAFLRCRIEAISPGACPWCEPQSARRLPA